MIISYYRKSILALILLFPLYTNMAFADTQKTSGLKQVITNFDEVEPGFYRSGCLLNNSYPYLKEAGIKTVINFIDHKSQVKKETEKLKELGIEEISIPWNGFDYPKDEDVQKFIQIVKDPAKHPVLIHCKRGAERTGLMVACYRVAVNGWGADRAYEEMKAHSFRGVWYGHLKKYLYNFAKGYGQTKAYSNNILEEAKTNTLYGIYRVRKLFPFLYN